MKEKSGKMSRFDWTWASERRGEQKVGSPEPTGRWLGFKACFSAETRLRKVLLIRLNSQGSSR